MTTATMSQLAPRQRARKIANGLKNSPAFGDRHPAAAQDLSDEASAAFQALVDFCTECGDGN